MDSLNRHAKPLCEKRCVKKKPCVTIQSSLLILFMCYRGSGNLTFLNLTDQAFISDALCVRNLLETGGFMERGLLFFFLKT